MLSIKCNTVENIGRVYGHSLQQQCYIHYDAQNYLCFREIWLSSAKRQRKYRARRNADPDRRASYLQKHREKWHRNKKLGKLKAVKDLSEWEKRKKRTYWRKAQPQSRERKVVENQFTPSQSPEVYPQPQMSR